MWNTEFDTPLFYLCAFAWICIIIVHYIISIFGPEKEHGAHSDMLSVDIRIYVFNIHNSLLRMESDHRSALFHIEERISALQNKKTSGCDANEYHHPQSGNDSRGQPRKHGFPQDEEIKKLKAVICTQNKEKEMLEHFLEQMSQRLSHLEENEAIKGNTIQRLTKKLFRMEGASSVLREKVNNFIIELSHTAGDRDRVAEENCQLKAVICNQNKDKEMLEHSLEQTSQRLSHLEETVAIKRNTMQTLTDKLFRMEEASSVLREKVNSLSIELSHTAKDRDLITAENCQIKAIISNQNKEKEMLEMSKRQSRLEKKLDDKENTIQTLREKLFWMEEDSSLLGGKLNSLNTKLSHTADDRNLVAEENRQLKGELFRCRQEVQNLTVILGEYKDAFTTMEVEYESSTACDGQIKGGAAAKPSKIKAFGTEIRHEEIKLQK